MKSGKGKLIIISAPSGAGKSTIVNHLLGRGLDLEFSISATTRPPRGNEINGKEYHFMQIEEFRRKIDDNEFVEWEEVYKDHYYGTLKSEIEKIRNKNHHVLFDVDVKGGINLKSIFADQVIAIFIMPPSVEELEKRLVTRGTDKPDVIRMRVEKAQEEMKLSGHFDHIVVNRKLEQAVDEVYNLVYDFINR